MAFAQQPQPDPGECHGVIKRRAGLVAGHASGDEIIESVAAAQCQRDDVFDRGAIEPQAILVHVAPAIRAAPVLRLGQSKPPRGLSLSGVQCSTPLNPKHRVRRVVRHVR